MTRDEELALIDAAIAAGKLTRVGIDYSYNPLPIPRSAIGRKNGQRKNGRNQSAKAREATYTKLGIS